MQRLGDFPGSSGCKMQRLVKFPSIFFPILSLSHLSKMDWFLAPIKGLEDTHQRWITTKCLRTQWKWSRRPCNWNNTRIHLELACGDTGGVHRAEGCLMSGQKEKEKSLLMDAGSRTWVLTWDRLDFQTPSTHNWTLSKGPCHLSGGSNLTAVYLSQRTGKAELVREHSLDLQTKYASNPMLGKTGSYLWLKTGSYLWGKRSRQS